jgi:hypothetical protein
LPWRRHVENEQTLIRYIELHDRIDVFGIECSDEAILEYSDRGFVIGRA